MIRLTATPTPPGELPGLSASSGLPPGRVYVGGPGGVAVAGGQQAVLSTHEGGRLEVLTSEAIGVTLTADGTYLNADDYARVADQTGPALRRYGARDDLAKLRTAPGYLTALTGLLALVTAVVGVFFVWAALTAPQSATVADRAQALIEWVQNPSSGGDPQARAAAASGCLAQIRGGTGAHVTVPGIPCTEVTTPLWRQAAFGSLLTGLVGVVSAVVGAVTVASKFGFQRSPAA